MPAASLMVALTPHMSQLSHAVEEHGSASSPSPATAASSSSPPGSQERAASPSSQRVFFSVERRPPGFAPARHTSCTVVAEIVVRGELQQQRPPAPAEPFEQLIWSRRFKVGKAARDGDTILEHRVFTVPVPEELFRYAEQRSGNGSRPRHGGKQSAAALAAAERKQKLLREEVSKHAFRVAPVPNAMDQEEEEEEDDDGVKVNKRRAGGASRKAPIVHHPTKSDLYAQEELEEQYSVVDELPDGCTFHLMCTLEIVRDTQRPGEEPRVIRRGLYETPIDATALLAAESSLLPVEMFAPFVEEAIGDDSGNATTVDIVAFASVFAVVGDQLAAATHGDESNPSLVSSFLALALAAQYDHLVFNVFRPELNLFKSGLQIALARQAAGGATASPSGTAAASATTIAPTPNARTQHQPVSVRQQPQAPQLAPSHSSPPPSRPPPPARDQPQQQQQQQARSIPASVAQQKPLYAAQQQAVLDPPAQQQQQQRRPQPQQPAFMAARQQQQQQPTYEDEKSPSARGAALQEQQPQLQLPQQQQQLGASRRAVLRGTSQERGDDRAAAYQPPSPYVAAAPKPETKRAVLQHILRKSGGKPEEDWPS